MCECVSSTQIKMKLSFILVCAVLLCTEAKVYHRDIYIALCSDTDAQSMYGLDGEEKFHSDFSQGMGVLTIPEFAGPGFFDEGAYETSVAQIENCKQNLAKCITAYNNPEEPKDAPQSSIYSKEDVELGINNTLICYITGFYPPRVKVSWTKNDVNMTDRASLSRYYPNSDGTYKLVSHLRIIPAKGDVYTCTVEHTALRRSLIKIWDVQVALPRVGPSVFCGVGLAIGLIGVAVGTFFLVKGNKCN